MGDDEVAQQHSGSYFRITKTLVYKPVAKSNPKREDDWHQGVIVLTGLSQGIKVWRLVLSGRNGDHILGRKGPSYYCSTFSFISNP